GTGKLNRRSRGGGKSGNAAAVAGFPSAVGKSRLWTFPRSGVFHGPFTHKLCYRSLFTKSIVCMKYCSEERLPPLFTSSIYCTSQELCDRSTGRRHQFVKQIPRNHLYSPQPKT